VSRFNNSLNFACPLVPGSVLWLIPQRGKLKEILLNILSLLGINVLFQLIALYGPKRKNLI